MSSYNKFPSMTIKGHENACIKGYDSILDEIKNKINKDKFTLCVETYPGVNDEEVLGQFNNLGPTLVINMINIFKSEESITEQMKYNLTDDRVFGKMYYGDVIDFIDLELLEKAKKDVENHNGLVLIYGFGATLVSMGDLIVYADMARWEIQMRYRKGLPNYKANNPSEDTLRKYKRAFFIEWRIADKHKITLFNKIDYVLDTNKENDPKLITSETFIEGLTQMSNQPFRTVPYFDPGVWGGQWMKEVCDLDREQTNFAWSFDGVPEENSIYFNFNGTIFEIPAMDLVLYRPKELLGAKVFSRFGAEFPIRFDFLDTIGGQNLSLQVHPLTEYMHRQFGMAYTQDESYYILDAKEGADVYLGLKDNVNKEEMIDDLRKSATGEITFDADKYVNRFPAKKHDHFLIPAGTIHCSAENTMVLEISATPYIFTFKLWDWGRLGLDGLPRPVHIEHGKEVIQWDRTTKWCQEQLVNAITKIDNPECVEEKTGLHELEFIETRRYWFDDLTNHDTKGTLNVLNLIEGEQIVIESVNNSFDPFYINYAETFIIPSTVGKYTIRPTKKGDKVAVLKAYVRDTFN